MRRKRGEEEEAWLAIACSSGAIGIFGVSGSSTRSVCLVQTRDGGEDAGADVSTSAVTSLAWSPCVLALGETKGNEREDQDDDDEEVGDEEEDEEGRERGEREGHVYLLASGSGTALSLHSVAARGSAVGCRSYTHPRANVGGVSSLAFLSGSQSAASVSEPSGRRGAGVTLVSGGLAGSLSSWAIATGGR